MRLRFWVSHSSLPRKAKKGLIEKLGEVVEVTAADERSQARNRELARERLASRLEEGLARPKKRKRTRRTRASNERRLRNKRARSQKKELRQPPDLDN